MPRYTDADFIKTGLKQEFCTACSGDYENNRQCCAACDIAYTMNLIDETPTADVEPVRHGRWIRGKNKSGFPAKPPAIWYCSCCGEMIRYNDSTGTYQKKKKKVNEVNPRCRRCGAKMDLDYQEGEP